MRSPLLSPVVIYVLCSCLPYRVYAQSTEQPTASDTIELDALIIEDERDAVPGEASGLNVEVLDTQRLANTTADLNEVIRRTPGVVVRETGGLGSTFDLSLNGLSGEQVRFFLDGIPSESFGSALTLNNFPTSLIQRLDVYKGVVPIALGADALGGAINIITVEPTETLVDAAVSLGSFQTYRAALVAQAVQDNNVFYRVNAFLNSSANNYRMDSVPVVDELGNLLGTASAKRFHDDYASGMLNFRAGIANRGTLQELSSSVTIAGNENEEQHPDTTINNVYGGVRSDNETTLASLTWKQRFGDWEIKSYALAGSVVETTYDELSRDYDWQGNFVSNADPNQGEIDTRSIFELKNDIVRASASALWAFSDNADASVNLTTNTIDRSGNDRLNANNTSFTFPNDLQKTILGIAYEPRFLNDRLKTSVFVKRYQFDATINASMFVQNNFINVQTLVDRDANGAGASARYKLNDALSITGSYERALRLPEADEILGSGKYIRPNPALLPERSHNVNLGVNLDTRTPTQRLELHSGLFYRDAIDFIRFVPDQLVFGIYENLASVLVRGMELGVDWVYQNRYFLQANATWQEITDEARVDDTGIANRNFNSQVPNTPYLFGNIRAGIEFDVSQLDRLALYWGINYVHEFFLNWENSGSQDDKFIIPEQITHDIDIEYTLRGGEWNAALSLRNVLDEPVFDNFNIQKPGRAAYLKFRYLY